MSRTKQIQINIAQSYVFFYIRNGMWQNLLQHCDISYRNLQDSSFIFWKAFAYYNLDDVNQSISQLTSIQSKRDVAFAVTVSLLFYNKKAESERQILQTLRIKERDQRKQATDKAITLTVHFYILVQQSRRAKDLLEQKTSPGLQFRLAKAYYAFSQGNQAVACSLYQQIYNSRDKSTPIIQIFLGRVRGLIGIGKPSDTGKIQAALQTINEAIVYYPDFVPLQLQRCQLLIMLNQWQQFSQSINSIVLLPDTNILSLKFYIFNLLVRDGNIDTAYFKLDQFQNLANKKQGQNGQLIYQAVQLFIRVCGRHPKILNSCMKLVAKCRSINPLNASYVIQQARIQLILGNIKQAYQSFQQASALDQSKMQSISGMIQCKIRMGDIQDIDSQIQFLNQMMVSVGRTPQISYLEALLSVNRNGADGQSTSLKFIDNTLKLQISLVKTLPPGFSFYVKLNPDFLYSIAQLYFYHIDMGQMLGGGLPSTPQSYCGKGMKLLGTIISQIPGFLPAHLLMAKGKLATGNWPQAMNSIGKVLSLDPKNEQAYILQSMSLSKKNEHESALKSLQEAISKNFKIRQNPLFMLIKGQIQFAMKDYQTAQTTVQMAYNLPGVKDNSIKVVSNFKIIAFSQRDRCSIFLLLAKVYACQKNKKACQSIMNEAIAQFSGTQEQVNVMLANASIALQQNDVKKAISILKTVTPASPYFVDGKKMLGQIYLNHMKSRRQYAKCYSDIIDNAPSLENYKLFGDALLRINQPEQAAIIFQKAHQLNPNHQGIIRDLGRSYSLSHDYGKTISFYQQKLKQLNNRLDLRIDLTKLYVMLKKFGQARKILQVQCFFNQQQTLKSYKAMKLAVQGFLLLANLQLKQQGTLNFLPNDQARKMLKSACKVQKQVIDSAKADGGNVQQQKKLLGSLFIKLARYYQSYQKNSDDTLNLLFEANKIFPQNTQIIEMMVTIYFRVGQFDKCQNKLQILQKLDSKNQTASSYMAQIMLRSNNYQKAVQQFQRTLNQKPDNYSILSRLIDFFRRNNQIAAAQKYLTNAERKASNINQPGLCFCRGLLHKYNRNNKSALTEFNKAKKSSQWAQKSLVHMIDIYLNPDQDIYYSAVDDQLRQVDSDNIGTCDAFLKQMAARASTYRFKAMQGLVSLLSNRASADAIAQNMAQILKNRPDYIPCILVIILAKLVSKKYTQARNFMKLVAGNNHDLQFGEQLQQIWMLNADSQIAIQKFDGAQDMLRKLLKTNKSSGKAEQLFGLIKQKQQCYVDAAEHYKKAYELTQQKSASIGYRLAFNYLKSKEYIQCIEICKKILHMYPKYPRIQKQVLEKAVYSLK